MNCLICNKTFDEINKAKFAAGKEKFGDNYVIWSEKDLQDGTQ